MKYMIVEDEFYARRSLIELMKELRPDWTLDFHAESVEDTVDYLESGKKPDLCLMDVELVDGNCFDIFRRHPMDIPVIFTTAYDEYALQAFRVNSIGYLLKPLDSEALRTMLDKFDRIFFRAPETAVLPQSRGINRILTSVGDRFDYVGHEDVAWFVSEDKYVYLYTRDGRKLMTTFRSLLNVEPLLDSRLFYRVSRALLISISSIDCIQKHFKGRLEIRLKAGKTEVKEIISAAKRADFLDWVGNR